MLLQRGFSITLRSANKFSYTLEMFCKLSQNAHLKFRLIVIIAGYLNNVFNIRYIAVYLFGINILYKFHMLFLWLICFLFLKLLKIWFFDYSSSTFLFQLYILYLPYSVHILVCIDLTFIVLVFEFALLINRLIAGLISQMRMCIFLKVTHFCLELGILNIREQRVLK